MKLSIVIPAFNEASRLPPALDRYIEYFVPRYGDEVEILVVVDGATDRTAAVAGERAARVPQVRVLVKDRNEGKGAAIMDGFRAARGDLVGFCDADGSTPPAAFQDLVDRIGDAGAIIASRWLPASRVSPRQPPARRFVSRVFNRLVHLLFGLRLTDTQCGAKLLRRPAYERIAPRLGITRWAFDVDLLYNLRRAGYAVAEIPTTWEDRRGSKLRLPRASLQMALAVIRLRLMHSPLRPLVTAYNRLLGRFIHPRLHGS